MLVNNAGVSFVEPVQGVSAERFAWKFQINVNAPIALMHHVMGGSSALICFASASPEIFGMAYSATILPIPGSHQPSA